MLFYKLYILLNTGLPTDWNIQLQETQLLRAFSSVLFKITPGVRKPPSADSAGPGPQASSCSRAPCTSYNSPEPQVPQLHNNTTFWQYSYLIETKLYSAVIENPVFLRDFFDVDQF